MSFAGRPSSLLNSSSAASFTCDSQNPSVMPYKQDWPVSPLPASHLWHLAQQQSLVSVQQLSHATLQSDKCCVACSEVKDGHGGHGPGACESCHTR